MCLLKQEIIVR